MLQAQSALSKHSARKPQLDGLRGFAILLVLCQHYFAMPYGWAGVDVFFVLSGYLITGILRSERREEHFWKMFYTRRATRILPPFLILIVAAVLTQPLAWHKLWPYFAFFGANVAAYKLVGELGVLNVLWSLAVEEHFYFIWPAVVRNISDRTLVKILVAVIVCEPLLRVAATHLLAAPNQAIAVLTPFRLDGLAWGALASIVLSKRALGSWTGRALCLGLAVSGSLFVICNRARHPLTFNLVGYSLLAFTSAALLASLVQSPKSWMARFFSLRGLTFLGGISYGLYLYHMLILSLFLAAFPSFQHRAVLSVVSFPFSLAVSWLSYRFVEEPFIKLGRQKVQEYKADAAMALTVA